MVKYKLVKKLPGNTGSFYEKQAAVC